MKVTGGLYFEICFEPPWQQLFGSGGRAAAALSELSTPVSLTTYVADKDRLALETLAATFGFSSHAIPIEQTVSFHYYHGLSEPRIIPSLHLISKAEAQTIQGGNILRFGFIEGDAIVHGERVVYDPQSAYDPRPFRENGSRAKQLAIVANAAECVALLPNQFRSADLTDVGKALLESEDAEAVVIKRGPFGVTIVTPESTNILPALRTSRVLPIGSGDVFAAVFAHFWAEENLDPFEASQLASVATAHYCETNTLPISAEVLQTFHREAIEPGKGGFPLKHNRVYLAGPFFTMPQRWMIEQSRTHLRQQGFQVFSPFHDVGYGPASKVVPQDVAGLTECDFVFAVADGLDSGTLFEIGYAKAMGKPVVAFVQNESDESLKMLSGTGCEISDDFASAIYSLTWTAIQT